MKKIYFYTFGCRLNKAETEELSDKLIYHFKITADISKADICIVNTCGVTQASFDKCVKLINKIKAQYSNLKIVVLGCAAKDIVGLGLKADYFFDKQSQPQASKIIIQKEAKSIEFKPQVGGSFARPFIKIQDGCNNYCAYCIVPHLRGREVSIPSQDIIAKIKNLEALSYPEVVVSGVNIGKYSDDGKDLFNLLSEILEETNNVRIRLSSINPEDLNDSLIGLFGNKRICDHIHLSLQSGSNKILKAMNRQYSQELYKEIVQKLRYAKKSIAITTDIIVGFPGESEENFIETMTFVEDIRFAKIHVFRYSPRPGTLAYGLPFKVNEKEKSLRSKRLIEVGKKSEESYKRSFIGEVLDVVFEGNKGQKGYRGVSSNFIPVFVKANQPLRKSLKKVRIIEAADYGLLGELVS